MNDDQNESTDTVNQTTGLEFFFTKPIYLSLRRPNMLSLKSVIKLLCIGYRCHVNADWFVCQSRYLTADPPSSPIVMVIVKKLRFIISLLC